ncbi:MAG: adenosylcobinamide-phosphate synthase CbiB, partial [Myxococcota bacterium]
MMDQTLHPALWTALVLGLALVWDGMLGEPPVAVHPVVWMGRAIRWVEAWAPEEGAWARLVFGVLMALVLPLGFGAGAWGVLWALEGWPWVHGAVAVFLLTSSFALRMLGSAAMVVRDALRRGDVEQARTELRALCSRDATALTPEQLIGGTIESMAENLSDSVVAPLFYFALFGVPGAVLYRVVNTLDAMVGYRNARYLHLGKASARLDDLLNIIPARLTALALIVAGQLLLGRGRRGWAVLRRDGHTTSSPNAGLPMAAMAGVMGVCLEKVDHDALGTAERPLHPESISEAWRIVTLASGLVIGLGALLWGG